MLVLRRLRPFGSALSVALLYLVGMPVHGEEPAAAAAAAAAAPVAADAAEAKADERPATLTEITVTARRRVESAQSVPLALSVLDGKTVADAGAFNVNRLKEQLPTVQFYSSNPRNSAINIRGIGAPFGLTNDGIEQGVGLYIDGVYFARPAAATLDFIDVERVEVLRGPQGTLYGKNTTAGAVNVTTRRPEFTPSTDVELSYGSYGFLQAKASTTGKLADKLAARISFSGTQRDGFLYNVRTEDDVNDLSNLGVRTQVLYTFSDALEFVLAGDYTRQRPEGYAQVIAGVAPTLRPARRQFAQIAADLNYTPPSFNAFDRKIDTDTPWRSNQDLGGGSFTADWKTAYGKLTAITAYRFWDWDPSNDRDFTGLPVTTKSAATSKQRQWSQEVRFAGDVNERLNYVVGLFGFHQTVDSDPIQSQEQGAAAARFLLDPNAAGYRPDLLDGYGQRTKVSSQFDSAAIFSQVEWKILDNLRALPGVRLNYDRKKVDYNNTTYGGPSGVSPQGQALQRSILSDQAYKADVDDTNVSGQFTLAWAPIQSINAYATYSKSYKSVGLNTAGVPNDANGQPLLNTTTVKPEDVNHYEIGIKTRPLRQVTVNAAAFQTSIADYQAQVVNAAAPGLLRGYLANADKVRVRGLELDANAKFNEHFTGYVAGALTDGKYVRFKDAPASLEGTGGPQSVDISGQRLPGISRLAASWGGEFRTPTSFVGREGFFFIALDASYRSSFSSSATPSAYLNVEDYTLLNGRLGFRGNDGWELFLWSRNLTDTNYFELKSAVAGNSGLYVGLPGDPQTWGATLRASF